MIYANIFDFLHKILVYFKYLLYLCTQNHTKMKVLLMMEGEAALDAEGMQTMRSLAKNMAYLLKATEGHPKPEYEARQAMHFIR